MFHALAYPTVRQAVVFRLPIHQPSSVLELLRHSLPRRSVEGTLVWTAIVLIAAAAVIAAYSFTERAGYAELAEKAMHQLDLYAAGIDSELSKYENLPSILDLDQDVLHLLQAPTDSTLRDKVNKALLNLNVRAGSLAMVLLDSTGAVIASSNWYEPDTFIGRDMSRASFFTDSLRNGQARSFVADKTRGTPHLFLARAIKQDQRVIGVAAVKVSLATVENTWIEYAASSGSEKLLVIDASDVVIMSSNPQWRYKTIGTLTTTQQQGLAHTDRYPDTSLKPLGLTTERVLHYGTNLVRIDAPGMAAKPLRFLSEEQAMSRPDWRLMTLSEVTPVWRDARNAALGAAGLAVLFALLVVHLRQRRRAIALQLAARQALQQANDELELRVEERTTELRQANAALIGEVVERKRAEVTLREAQDELVRASRLALLGRMSAAITHEINQPLTAMRALSDNCRRLLVAGRVENVDRNLAAIADLTERMGRITKQLKSFARKAPAMASPTPLSHAVGSVLEILGTRVADEQVQVQLDIPDGLRVLCDSYRLEQVLLNLMGNAMDAMKDSATKRLGVSATIHGDRARIRVRDSGSGLPESVLNHLFEPFFSTKPPGEGLGLGLVISSGIVKEFGSSLRASSLSDGAAFEFDMQLEKEFTDVV